MGTSAKNLSIPSQQPPLATMPVSLEGKLVVAISSRALFNLEEENRLFDSGDPEGYMRLQLERMNEPARLGIAASLVKKLLRFNDDGVQRVEVVILSRNDPVSGLRIFRSAGANAIQPAARGVYARSAAVRLFARTRRASVSVGERGRCAGGAAGGFSGRTCAGRIGARERCVAERSAHRVRRRRGAVLRRSGAGVSGAGARRIRAA